MMYILLLYKYHISASYTWLHHTCFFRCLVNQNGIKYFTKKQGKNNTLVDKTQKSDTK